jgi:hypothetical protein
MNSIKIIDHPNFIGRVEFICAIKEPPESTLGLTIACQEEYINESDATHASIDDSPKKSCSVSLVVPKRTSCLTGISTD